MWKSLDIVLLCGNHQIKFCYVEIIRYRDPTHPGKQEKPGNFIPLRPGWVIPLKIEKTAKIGRNPNSNNTAPSIGTIAGKRNITTGLFGLEKPLKFGYRKSLDNIKLLPFDRCSFVPLQLRISEFCGVSLVRQ